MTVPADPHPHHHASADAVHPAYRPVVWSDPDRSIVRRIALAPVFAYRKFLSPMLGARCRFEPSCSAYAVQAVDRFGILRGLVLASWRVARCNPLGGQGIDLPEDQRIFPLSARLKRAPQA